MMDLKSQKTTYEIGLDEMKTMIAERLQVPVEAVTVEYVTADISSEREVHPRYVVRAVRITVDHLMSIVNFTI